MINSQTLNSIDLSRMPKWDFCVRLRGMEIPMISPLDAPEMNEAPMPTQAQLDAQTRRWPGVFVWLKRAVLGSPRIGLDELPQDGGAAHTRKVCTIILGEPFADLIAELSHGECAMIYTAYMGAQEEWVHACARHAKQMASEHLRTGDEPDETPSPSAASQTTLVPGQPYPYEAKLNPKIYHEDGTPRS
tara:strand:+ start:46022 stop:46588 length:567 start_codon:yes stop_codon:yes gene_type:complete